ncbi:MAG: luciferase family protein [Nitrososphaera sp.]
MTVSTKLGRMLGNKEVFEKIKTELMSWHGVTLQPHRFGGLEFRFNGREMGHMHSGKFADLPFPMSIRNELVKDRRALPHHVLPNSGWVTFRINEEADTTSLINLFRMQYERLSGTRNTR